MSMNLMAKAMGLRVGNPLRKLVLIKLADNANDKGECWPSYQHIADQCEIGRSTVKNHIRALEDMGMIRRQFRKSGDLNQSNLFYITLDNPTPKDQLNGGAGDDLGQEMTGGVGQAMTESGSTGDRGGRAGDDPITSHLFEPVIEPIPTPVAEAPRSGKYSFEGNIIRLNHRDFEAWLSLYPNIDLRYELQKLDLEFTHDKPAKWFITASQKLSYQNKQAMGKDRTQINQPHWNSAEAWEDFI